VDTPPPAIEELTLLALDYVKRALDFALDFSPETLPVLDHYAKTVRDSLAENPALGKVVAPALGAYFGEVVRARFSGFWRIPSPNQQDWSVCSRVAFLAVNPLGVAFDAVFGGSDHDGPSSALRLAPEDRQFIDQRLATIPPVPEDEYFSFATRFEVLEIVVESLTAKMQEEGYGGTEFSPEDYGVDYSVN
jgi:hypothetical protein